MRIPVLNIKHIFGTTVLAGLLLFTAPASAAVIFSADSTFTSAGATGVSFDITLTNTGGAAITVEVFGFEILSSSTDITFTDATTGTVSHPYIFTGHSLFGPDIVTSSPGQVLDASDFYDIPASGATVGSGVTVGLGRIFFDVSPSASTPQVVTVSFNAGNSSLSDPNGSPITINQFSPGTITIGAESAVPEPGSLLLMSIGIAGLAWRRRRR